MAPTPTSALRAQNLPQHAPLRHSFMHFGAKQVGRSGGVQITCSAQAPTRLPALRPSALVAQRPQRNGLVVHASQAAAPQDPVKRRSDLLKGCRTTLIELQGLDFPRSEVSAYFQFATTLPKGVPKDMDLAQVREAVVALCGGSSSGGGGAGGAAAAPAKAPDALLAEVDLKVLEVVSLMLADIWRWRRRGGGMEDEEGLRPAALALEALQSFKQEDIDRITSSLLDNLKMSEEEKRELSGGVQQIAVAGFQGAVWGSLLLCLAFLVFFNFLRQ